MRALMGSGTVEPRLRRGDFDIALANVGEQFWRPNNHVNERPKERNQRSNSRATHEEPVANSATRVKVRPRN